MSSVLSTSKYGIRVSPGSFNCAAISHLTTVCHAWQATCLSAQVLMPFFFSSSLDKHSRGLKIGWQRQVSMEGWVGGAGVAVDYRQLQVFPGLLAKPEPAPASSIVRRVRQVCLVLVEPLSAEVSTCASLKRNVARALCSPPLLFGACIPLLLVWRLLELDHLETW
jgi:hypothetical protein